MTKGQHLEAEDVPIPPKLPSKMVCAIWRLMGLPGFLSCPLQLQFGSHAQLCFHVPNVTPDALAGEPSCLDS